jgi:hypothetical protein
MEATGYAVLMVGIVCGVAAIVGGDVSLPGGARFPTLSSPVRVALGLMAALLLITSAVFIVLPHVPGSVPAGDGPRQPTASERLPQAGPCTHPKISLSKGKGPSGTKVTITGTGFPSNADVETRFHVETMAPALTDEKGAFEGRVVIPGSLDPFAPQQFDISASTTSPTVCSARAPFRLTD